MRGVDVVVCEWLIHIHLLMIFAGIGDGVVWREQNVYECEVGDGARCLTQLCDNIL